ncbi:hypothetical protein NDGK_00491 [Clostridiales bacterium CHKCI001]|nr:hypothetical protein NDGK_00491 [Clostridiales bacterium CHKCI001]
MGKSKLFFIMYNPLLMTDTKSSYRYVCLKNTNNKLKIFKIFIFYKNVVLIYIYLYGDLLIV